mmetsp:Transcript_95125/g.268745  ORF Transcript_95125/g.268745 Transcript_95125/m.268745 type:complete len:222 (+) Transcript_95125:1115-1780(+)
MSSAARLDGLSGILVGLDGYVQLDKLAGHTFVFEHPHNHGIDRYGAMESVFPEGLQWANWVRGLGLGPHLGDDGARFAICLSVCGDESRAPPALAVRGNSRHCASRACPRTNVALELAKTAELDDPELDLQQPVIPDVFQAQRRLRVQSLCHKCWRHAGALVATRFGLAHKIRLVELHTILHSEHVLQHQESRADGRRFAWPHQIARTRRPQLLARLWSHK